jgi:hypothetical protein
MLEHQDPSSRSRTTTTLFSASLVISPNNWAGLYDVRNDGWLAKLRAKILVVFSARNQEDRIHPHESRSYLASLSDVQQQHINFFAGMAKSSDVSFGGAST